MLSAAGKTRRELRAEFRAARRALAPRSRATRAEALARHVARSPIFWRAGHIACYLANDGEMDLSAVIERIWAAGKRAYVPVLNTPKLWFYPLEPGTALQPNRFGILEPALAPRRRVSLLRLDLVLVPLVAFDRAGNRLGMGGGYYDQTFAYLLTRRHWQSPALIGVAYEFQRRDALDSKPWDVPLKGVVTENGVQLAT